MEKLRLTDEERMVEAYRRLEKLEGGMATASFIMGLAMFVALSWGFFSQEANWTITSVAEKLMICAALIGCVAISYCITGAAYYTSRISVAEKEIRKLLLSDPSLRVKLANMGANRLEDEYIQNRFLAHWR